MMQLIYALGVVLMVVFSASWALYLTQYKLGIRSGLCKKIVFTLALGAGIFAGSFTVSVFIVWPPVLPL